MTPFDPQATPEQRRDAIRAMAEGLSKDKRPILIGGHAARGESIAQRVARQISVAGDDECWPWLGQRSSRGYGRTAWGGKHLRAHRVIWELVYGEMQAGMVVCHRCDNPPCCNPSHLWIGTDGDNLRDMYAKNRHSDRSGENNGVAKVTTDQVIEMRALRAGGWKLAQLAKRYGITFQTVSNIVRRDVWRHVA